MKQQIINTKQGTSSVIEYYNSPKGLLTELDLYQNVEMESAADSKMMRDMLKLWHDYCNKLSEQKRNAWIFEDKWRSEGMLWDLLHFYSSLWACCIVASGGVPLSVIQLNWLSVCDSKV